MSEQLTKRPASELFSESTLPATVKRVKTPSGSHGPVSGEEKSHALTDNHNNELTRDFPLPSAEASSKKWDYFEHNGVLFPESWQRHFVKITYKDEAVALDDYQEEIATYWAQGANSDWNAKPFYRENFKRIFLGSFEESHPLVQRHGALEFEGFGFEPLVAHLEAEKKKREAVSKEDKARSKSEREQLDQRYKFIIVDNRLEKIANFKIEPPTLFKGRGEHPKAGTLKQRTMPEDVELNLAKSALVPVCHLPGRAWGAVSFDNESSWVASYLESCTESRKYALLSASSKIKFENDIKKYERARRLKNCIDHVRADYRRQMGGAAARDRQLGTAAYFIDFLAIRAGNEKKEDEADTVGCCSLRKEHVRLEGDSTITLDFLGKDSMRYLNTVQIDPQAYKNLEEFVRGKKADENIFDLINSSKLNDYLHSLMEELTAKVFRTFNASNTLQSELEKAKGELSSEDSLEEKLRFYNEANRQVAVLCNHQKGVSKTFDASLEKQEEKLKALNSELKALGKKEAKGSKGDKLKAKIAKLQANIDSRQKNKSIALGTSKTNYNDPRISVAWCKAFEVPIEKIFTAVLLEKFTWAMSCESNWRF